jgi:protein SCO1/2
MMDLGTPRAMVVAMAAALLLSAGACARGGGPADDQRPSAHDVAGPGEIADGESIFDLDLDLMDQDGREMDLADLHGDVMVAAMVYTSCTSVCIMVTEQMKAIEQQLAAVDADVKYVLFSLDPGRDTPDAMRAFARDHKLDGSRWRLMAASEDGVRDLAAVLGVKYQQEENGEFAHSAMIFVIDDDGIVRHRQVGVGKDSSELVAAVRKARG